MNPFDYLNTINFSKKDIMVDKIAEKGYNAWVVNKTLSYFQDTVLMANEMNINAHLDNRLQYDFLLNIVRKRKRFTKWAKPEQLKNLELIQEYYNYSPDKAKQALDILSEDDIKEIKSKMYTGGKK